ncbi:MAG: hypothetical protein SFT91_03965 [Rickettsiaceae bacterium]|nr:hypothetical protein [Rickettsiaceae bacterium]
MSVFHTHAKQALWKVTKNLIRDFSELEVMQSGNNLSVARFVSMSKVKSRELLERELRALNFRSISFSDDPIPQENGIHILVGELEGLENLSKALPFFGCYIVQIKISNGITQILAASATFPALGVMCYAEDGQGAWTERYDDKLQTSSARLRSSGQKNITNTLVNHALSSQDERFPNSRHFGSFLYDLSAFAFGKLDAILIPSSLNILTFALELFAKEAGGYIIKKDNGDVIASGAALGAYLK